MFTRYNLVNTPFYVFLFFFCFATMTIRAQTLYTQNINGGTYNFTDPGGVIVPAGNVIYIDNADLTFTNGLKIGHDAIVNINHSKVKIGADKYIVLQNCVPISNGGSQWAPWNQSGGEIVILNSLVTSINSSVNDMWGGIKAEEGIRYYGTGPAKTYMDGSTIQYSKCAWTTGVYIPPYGSTSNPVIFAQADTFRNNIRNIYSSESGTPQLAGSTLDPAQSLDIHLCTFDYTEDFPLNPPDMVYLEDNVANSVLFSSCSFLGKTTSPAYTTGINGVNTECIVQKDPYASYNSRFVNLKKGITNTANLTAERHMTVKNTFFYCRYAIDLSSNVGSSILNCSFAGPVPLDPSIDPSTADYCFIFLRNCTSYAVEGNAWGYDIPDNWRNKAGLVVMNSGPANNEIYRNGRNSPVSLNIQALGTNKSVSGMTGLKILCNQNALSNYDISVMKDVAVNSNNGIHNLQYIQGINPSLDISAANRFTALPYPIVAPYGNYYIEPGVNNLAQFVYKYNTNTPNEKPNNTNVPLLLMTNANTCPPHNTSTPPPPFPFSSFIIQLHNAEDQINSIESNPAPTYSDTVHLSYLLSRHSAIIDSVIDPYRRNADIDSIILVYQQVKVGYHYRVMLAAAYGDKSRYDDATQTLLQTLDNYSLTADEQEQINRAITMYTVIQWLDNNNNDWAKLPEEMKQSVYDADMQDPMYAGAIARYLRVKYEGFEYDPIFRSPEALSPLSASMTLKQQEIIYPNPAHNKLFVRWAEDNATLTLTSINGEVLLRQSLQHGVTGIPLDKLAAGVYIAQIEVGSKMVYKQKIIKD